MSAAISYAHAAAKKEPVAAAMAELHVTETHTAAETPVATRSTTETTSPAEISESSHNNTNTTNNTAVSSSSSTADSKIDNPPSSSSSSSTPPSSSSSSSSPAPAALAPAPLPSKNAWGKIDSTVPASVDLKSIIDHNNTSVANNAASTSTITTNSNIKWVPYKGANIIISDSSSGNNGNHNSANGSNKKKSKKSKKKTPASNGSSAPSSASAANGSSSSATERKHQNQSNPPKKSSKLSNGDAVKTPSDKQPFTDNASTDSPSTSEINDSSKPSSVNDENSSVKNSPNLNNNNTKAINGNRRYTNNTNNKYNNNGNPANPRYNKNYYNNFYPQQNFQYYPDFSNGYAYNPNYQNVRYQQNYNYHRNSNSSSNGNYHRNNSNGNNNNYPHYNHNRNFNYRTKYVNNFVNAPAMNWISPESRLAAVNSIALQLDYYFNISNLLKDMYLRKHMNSQGWIDLDFITGFYRVRALSCGDLSVIRDALEYSNQFEWGVVEREERESKPAATEEATKETENEPHGESSESKATTSEQEIVNPIANIKIRALTEPLNWVLPESDREGCGLEEAVPSTIHQKETPAEAESVEAVEQLEQEQPNAVPESIEQQ